MSVHLVTAPAFQPVPLSLLKTHCHIDPGFTGEDAVLGVYLAAATDTCQQLIGRSIMLQTWRLDVDCSRGPLPLAWPEVREITGIEVLADDGTWSDVDSSIYLLDGNAAVLAPDAEWPEGRARATYTAGYASGNEATQQAAVPPGIKSWVLLTAGTMYANRESIATSVTVAALPGRFTDGLLDAYKVYA